MYFLWAAIRLNSLFPLEGLLRRRRTSAGQAWFLHPFSKTWVCVGSAKQGLRASLHAPLEDTLFKSPVWHRRSVCINARYVLGKACNCMQYRISNSEVQDLVLEVLSADSRRWLLAFGSIRQPYSCRLCRAIFFLAWVGGVLFGVASNCPGHGCCWEKHFAYFCLSLLIVTLVVEIQIHLSFFFFKRSSPNPTSTKRQRSSFRLGTQWSPPSPFWK